MNLQAEAVATDDRCCGPWKCFFCGEVFPDAITATRHFGEPEGCEFPVPGCVDPLRRDEKARLHAVQIANYEAMKAIDERDAAREDADAYRAQPAEIERLFGQGVRTPHDAWLVLDEMKGRALAAEERTSRLRADLDEAERKAWDAIGRYKFQMFGYWAAIWVHLNRIGGFNESNPWRDLVKSAREREGLK